MNKFREMDKGGWEPRYLTAFTKFRFLYDHCAIHRDGETAIDPHESARIIDGIMKQKKQSLTNFYGEMRDRDQGRKRRAPKTEGSCKKGTRRDEPPPPPPPPNQGHLGGPNFVPPVYQQGTLRAAFEHQRDLHFADDALDDERYGRLILVNRAMDRMNRAGGTYI